MSKKVLIFLILTTVVIIGYVIYSSKNKPAFFSPLIEEKSFDSAQDEKKTVYKKYTDEAGFSFSYPEEVEINKNEVKDESIYSSLEISTKKEAGKISFLVTSSNLTAIDNYFTQEKKTVKKLKIGEMEARQFEDKEKIVTVALDQGALFTVTVDYKNNKSYWQGVNNKIISTFAFSPPEQNDSSSQGSTNGQDDVIYEGEEEVN